MPPAKDILTQAIQGDAANDFAALLQNQYNQNAAITDAAPPPKPKAPGEGRVPAGYKPNELDQFVGKKWGTNPNLHRSELFPGAYNPETGKDEFALPSAAYEPLRGMSIFEAQSEGVPITEQDMQRAGKGISVGSNLMGSAVTAPAGVLAAGAARRARAEPPTIGHNNPPPTRSGSQDIAKNEDIRWNDRDLAELNPQDFAEMGQHYGVKNLGPETPATTYKYTSDPTYDPKLHKVAPQMEFQIPGGTEGTFTYYDMLKMKSQGIDASRIPDELHTQIQQKMVRTMMPEDASNEHIFNSMIFGMTSPNQPLGPNQMAASRIRARGPEDISKLGDMISWKAGDKVSKADRTAAGERIANHFGVQSAGKGGLGVRGSADYTRMAELAQLYKKDPGWFRKGAEETWPHYVSRLETQVQGLGTKTASFSAVWQDPMHAAVSAIDRHMAKIFYEDIFPKGSQRMDFERTLGKRWAAKVDESRQLAKDLKAGKITADKFKKRMANLPSPTAKKAKGLGAILQEPGGDGFFTDQMLGLMGSKSPKWRTAMKGKGNKGKTEINPNLPEELRAQQWVREPEQVGVLGDTYAKALDANAKNAAKEGLGLFASQWKGWDRIRRRLEPHENMFPGLEKMPVPSLRQAKSVMDAQRQTGHLDYTKKAFHGKEGLDMRLKPTVPLEGNPAKLGYFSGGPAAGPASLLEAATGEKVDKPAKKKKSRRPKRRGLMDFTDLEA